MNIFVLSNDFEECSKWHLDKHIVKMPLETAQLLCTALHINGFKNTPYKPTHSKHPCTIWTAHSKQNFIWLCNLGKFLCAEYSYRYGKIHKCQEVINICEKNHSVIPDNTLTDFAQAMPEIYKKPNAVEAYREYYRNDKKHIANWSKRDIPYWFV